MAELGETTDARALVPGDPQALDAAQGSMARLGQALLQAGDGLSRIGTEDWEGSAADAFRAAFDGVPAQWRGSGEAFADAADALSDHRGVLAWAQDEAAQAVREWNAADGEAGRATARARLDAARMEVGASGGRAAEIIGRARDRAPPSWFTRLAGAVGDVAAGAGHELVETGQFLWQVDPARLFVEPVEAVDGWKDLATGVAAAATHPQQAVDGALPTREIATNPERFVGEIAVGVGLSALAGAGIARRLRGAAAAGRIADALDDPSERSGAPSAFRPGTWAGKTGNQHVADGGATIGRAGSGKRTKNPTREVDTSEEIDELYRALGAGGEVVRRTQELEVTALPDGTFLTWRPASKSTPDGAALDIRNHDGIKLKVHTPRGGIR